MATTIKLSARSCSYWRSRAITAEQKVLEFHEQIALLGAPARDGVRPTREFTVEQVLEIYEQSAGKNWEFHPARFTETLNKALRDDAAKEQADGR